jgi:tetratricopeptide (TPR) repeat protein
LNFFDEGDALAAAQKRGDASDMLENCTLTAAYLERGAEHRELTATERRSFGELLFRIGIMHSLQRGDHATAVTWFDRAIPLWEEDSGQVAARDICIFELNDRVGGRLYSLRGLGPKGDLTVDVGGYRTWPLHTPVLHAPVQALGGGDAWDAGFIAALQEMGDEEGLLTVLHKLRRQQPSPDLSRRLAELLERRGQFQEAALLYRDLLGPVPTGAAA